MTFKAAGPTARFAPLDTHTLLARLLLKGVPADWDGLDEQNPRPDGTLVRPNAKTRCDGSSFCCSCAARFWRNSGAFVWPGSRDTIARPWRPWWLEGWIRNGG